MPASEGNINIAATKHNPPGGFFLSPSSPVGSWDTNGSESVVFFPELLPKLQNGRETDLSSPESHRISENGRYTDCFSPERGCFAAETQKDLNEHR